MSKADPRHEVSDIANEHEISEMVVFDRAYREWYGAPAGNRILERDFGRYLTHGDIPVYVTAYCRRRLPAELRA